MNIRIVTDSTCDLPAQVVREHQISVIPIFIHIGEENLRDGVDLTRQEFFQRLPDYKPHPTTAAPGPEVFKQVYDGLAAEGAEQILSIHISHRLSAVVDAAREGARQTTSLPVTVLDSRQLSLGTGYQVLIAAQAARAGHSMEEILVKLDEQIARTHVFAALDTLEYLRRSGRMSLVLFTLGALLQIKPFLEMYEGSPTASRVRTRRGARKRFLELLNKYAPYERAALLHANASERALELLEEVRLLLPQGEVWVEEINPALGAHLGPGVIGFAGVSKNPAGGSA